MKQVTVLLVAVLACGIVAVPARATDTDDQVRIARAFLSAYLIQDAEGIRAYLPKEAIELFGPFPYKAMPTQTQPKVHKNQAIVEFTGTVKDDKLPVKCGLIMRRYQGEWYVRQVYFYDKIPMIFQLPTKSVTDEDRAQEARVATVAGRFMTAWKNGNDATMLKNWFNWTRRKGDRIDGLSMSNVEITPTAMTWKDPYMRFSLKLTYRFGPLSYSMSFKGGLLMTREESGWKVRANTLVFDF